MDEEIFFDEIGRRYILITKIREIPRRTYILGVLKGKYWGEKDIEKEDHRYVSDFYDFFTYETEILINEIKDNPFHFFQDLNFPTELVGWKNPAIIKYRDKNYAVEINEHQFGAIKFISPLHQTEGKEIFGTFETPITGYLLDYTAEEYKVKEYLPTDTNTTESIVSNTSDSDDETPEKTPEGTTYTKHIPSVKTKIPTGNFRISGNYTNTEYWNSDFKTKYDSGWKYKKTATTPASEGCLSSTFGILGGIIGIAFLILLLPRIAIILPFILLPIIFRLIPEAFWAWIFRLIGILLLIGFVVSIINAFNHSSHSYVPKSVVQDKPEERKPQYNPIVDTVNQTPTKDTLITHFRSWSDYDGNEYEGKFWVKKSAFLKASSFKNKLNISDNTEDSYNEMVYRLKENDKNNLQGIYQLFDSIKAAKKLPSDKFAELIVSFVQDIPYTVVLPNACDGSLYADNFIKSYLASNDARCDGYEKFGINTPVEFMATLNGDCDTRTLLIYTILSHYGYDVAMLSSEYYNHSLIGINLPYDGIAYTYNTQRYVLWETTAPNIKPGILPNEISNLNYWRISLKSK